MWGAIIGDLAGSIYEYTQSKKISSLKIDKIIPDNAFFSDDTILTIAILDAVINDKDYEKYLKLYGKKYSLYKPNFEPYFKTIFSPRFHKWLETNEVGNSCGNGAMMRISSVGYMFNSEEEVKINSKLATIPSHNSLDAIKNAELVALIIYYGKKGYTKEQIIEKLNIKLQYIPFKSFNLTCSETINNCLFALFNSNSFEESIKNVISYGGDTDTNACIVGSMAEALYGINKSLINTAKQKLPEEFVKVLNKVYK